MIPIEDKKRIDWNAIRAEYIGGGISQRKLAAKHGIKYQLLRDRSIAEGWVDMREAAQSKSIAKAEQKTAEAAAENATIAADMKKRLLLRLSRIEQKYPFDATEIRTHEGKSTVIFRIRDLTAAFKDLTEDIQAGSNATNELLQSLLDLERRTAT